MPEFCLKLLTIMLTSLRILIIIWFNKNGKNEANVYYFNCFCKDKTRHSMETLIGGNF